MQRQGLKSFSTGSAKGGFGFAGSINRKEEILILAVILF
jgi:hypothetical protein